MYNKAPPPEPSLLHSLNQSRTTPTRTLDHFSPLFPTCGPHFSPISPTLGHDDEQDSHQSQSITKETQEMVALRSPRQLFGVKLCGDNANWNVTSSFICADCHTLSIHYFHSYAVQRSN